VDAGKVTALSHIPDHNRPAFRRAYLFFIPQLVAVGRNIIEEFGEINHGVSRNYAQLYCVV